MKKLLFGLFLFIAVGFISYMFLFPVSAQEALSVDPTEGAWIMAVPDSNPNHLPTACLWTKSTDGGSKCLGRIVKLAKQGGTSQRLQIEGWIKATNECHHNHLIRLHVKSYWVWIGHGSLIWPRLLKKYVTDQSIIGVIGPKPLRDVAKNASQCDALAAALFVNITTDAGAIYQRPPRRHNCAPPSDGGAAGDCTYTPQPWPDSGVGNRASAYWLLRSRWGGRFFRPWSASLLSSTKGRPTRCRQALIPPNIWKTPDARTSHQCTFPVGTPCP